jgi:TPR repeat protein
MCNLGMMYEFGKGVKQDFSEAMKWYRTAAEKRSSLANYRIALLYEAGKGVTQDYAEAMKWYKKIVGNNDGYIMYHIGKLYEEGKGVPADKTEAAKWYLRSAESDNGLGMYGIGRIHEQEDRAALALTWYHKSVQWLENEIKRSLDNTEAMMGLAYMYETGKGVEKNMQQAIVYYKRAADWGEID